jgi:hypothetical protein
MAATESTTGVIHAIEHTARGGTIETKLAAPGFLATTATTAEGDVVFRSLLIEKNSFAVFGVSPLKALEFNLMAARELV